MFNLCVFIADEEYEDGIERTCDTLLMCIVTVLNQGLRNGGGVGDVLRRPSKDVSWRKKHFFKENIIIFYNLFIYFERERQHTSTSRGGAERGRKNPKQTPHCHCRAQCGAWTHGTVRSWPEPKPRFGGLTDWATQALPNLYLLDFIFERIICIPQKLKLVIFIENWAFLH